MAGQRNRRIKYGTTWRTSNCFDYNGNEQRYDENNADIDSQAQETICFASSLYYEKAANGNSTRSTQNLVKLCDFFEKNLVKRAQTIKATKSKWDPKTSGGLHPDLMYNTPEDLNKGLACSCSPDSTKFGLRVYPGEKPLKTCNPLTNNADRLYHYRLIVSPKNNFSFDEITIIHCDEHDYTFEGFSMFSHFPLGDLPHCKIEKFNLQHNLSYVKENFLNNFTLRELNLFQEYLFKEILELAHFNIGTNECSPFHFMPRFVRKLPNNKKELLPMYEVLQYLLNNSKPLIKREDLETVMNESEWQVFLDEIKNMVITSPGKKPCSVRVDHLSGFSNFQKRGNSTFPEVIHFGSKPPNLPDPQNLKYEEVLQDYTELRQRIKTEPTSKNQSELKSLEEKLNKLRDHENVKRNLTTVVSSEGFYCTGIRCDIVQYAVLLPVVVCFLRFQGSLNVLEEDMNYKFKNRRLLQLSLTHPSFNGDFGMNPDHVRNTLSNCGSRKYPDSAISAHTRGISALYYIMSKFGRETETESDLPHNERLEFFGDAVVQLLVSRHLFYTFPDFSEGDLTTYRSEIVQNRHLAVLAKKLNLNLFLLHKHVPNLDFNNALANCFEALIGALYLDGGYDSSDRIFSETLFKNEPDILEVWANLPLLPLQEAQPAGDRHMIPTSEFLQHLVQFEKSIDLEFNHIELLAEALTDENFGYSDLCKGSNQRLEFFGDTVLKLIATEYLYKYFPEHREGHLTLLRSVLISNITLAKVCDDLGLTHYARYNKDKNRINTKNRADLLEAFVGALYVDQGMEFCQVVCQVALFPRLEEFIANQSWVNSKCQLEHCCLMLRKSGDVEPKIPVYKLVATVGPLSRRQFTISVFVEGHRLGTASAHSIRQAEIKAAEKALNNMERVFPEFCLEKRTITKRTPHKIKNMKFRPE